MAKSERENKASEKGMAHVHGQPNSIRQVTGNHAGERGHQIGVVFRLPKDSEVSDHSKVRSPEHG
jgi:hypothetical protein